MAKGTPCASNLNVGSRPAGTPNAESVRRPNPAGTFPSGKVANDPSAITRHVVVGGVHRKS